MTTRFQNPYVHRRCIQGDGHNVIGPVPCIVEKFVDGSLPAIVRIQCGNWVGVFIEPLGPGPKEAFAFTNFKQEFVDLFLKRGRHRIEPRLGLLLYRLQLRPQMTQLVSFLTYFFNLGLRASYQYCTADLCHVLQQRNQVILVNPGERIGHGVFSLFENKKSLVRNYRTRPGACSPKASSCRFLR